jgi:hypothetical protein
MFRRENESGEVFNWMISKIDDCTDKEIVPVIAEKTPFTYTFRTTLQKALQLQWDDHVIGKYLLIRKSDPPYLTPRP